MGLFDKLRRKEPAESAPVQSIPVMPTADANRPTVSPAPVVPTPKSGMEQIKRGEGIFHPNERLKYLWELRGEMDSWSDHEKAYCYYLLGNAAKVLYGERKVHLAFYAAQLYYDPDSASAGWMEFIANGFSPSEENARKLHAAYPLPNSISQIESYSAEMLQNTPAPQTVSQEPPKPEPQGKQVGHIVCLCYDRPYTQGEKLQIQNHIVEGEISRGNRITPTSRITFDSFYDNANLHKSDMIREKLIQIYTGVYGPETAVEKAQASVPEGELSGDGGMYAKFFVWYE